MGLQPFTPPEELQPRRVSSLPSEGPVRLGKQGGESHGEAGSTFPTCLHVALLAADRCEEAERTVLALFQRTCSLCSWRVGVFREEVPSPISLTILLDQAPKGWQPGEQGLPAGAFQKHRGELGCIA